MSMNQYQIFLIKSNDSRWGRHFLLAYILSTWRDIQDHSTRVSEQCTYMFPGLRLLYSLKIFRIAHLQYTFTSPYRLQCLHISSTESSPEVQPEEVLGAISTTTNSLTEDMLLSTTYQRLCTAFGTSLFSYITHHSSLLKLLQLFINHWLSYLRNLEKRDLFLMYSVSVSSLSNVMNDHEHLGSDTLIDATTSSLIDLVIST